MKVILNNDYKKGTIDKSVFFLRTLCFAIISTVEYSNQKYHNN
jgi:hypothetical protein